MSSNNNNTSSIGTTRIWKAGVLPHGATPITQDLVSAFIAEVDELSQHEIVFEIANCFEGLHSITIDSHKAYVSMQYPDCFNKFFTCPQLQNYSYFFKCRVLFMFLTELGKLQTYVNQPFFVAVREHFAEEIGDPGIPDTVEKFKQHRITTDEAFAEFIREFHEQQQNNN